MQLLYEAGCEQSPMQKLQICLLMSSKTDLDFENGIMPREDWLVEAQRIIENENIPHLLAENSLPLQEAVRWRILYACCIVRVISLFFGSQRPTVLSGLPFEIPVISQKDLEDDARAPWHLPISEKYQLAEIFLAKLELFRHISLICNAILQHSAQKQSLAKTGAAIRPRHSITGELEVCESDVCSWKTDYAHLLDRQPKASPRPTPDELPVLVHKAFLQLTFE